MRQLALSIRRDAWQDTPFVKAPYTAAVTVPSPLTTVVMSAQNIGNTTNADGSVTFRCVVSGVRSRAHRPGRACSAWCAAFATRRVALLQLPPAGAACELSDSAHRGRDRVQRHRRAHRGLGRAEPLERGARMSCRVGCNAAWDILLCGVACRAGCGGRLSLATPTSQGDGIYPCKGITNPFVGTGYLV